RNLVIDLPDGTQMVIVDGAVFVPRLVLGDVEVPATNLAALLIDSEIRPAAGVPQSGGGNFEIAVGPLDPGVALGDLIPPTELVTLLPDFKEGLFDLDRDSEPTILIQTPGQLGVTDATVSVSESALPARGAEPAGSNSASTAESTVGTIVFEAADAPFVIAINGVPVTAIGQTIAGTFGVLTVTSISNGLIGYSYTLSDNSSGNSAREVFTASITDRDGDAATATLRIDIVDDVPTARDDSQTQAAENASITVNVVANDTFGADGVNLDTGVELVAGSLSVTAGQTAGTLVDNANGTFTYNPSAGQTGTVTFQYRIIDGDGDPSVATVTITLLADSAPTILIAQGSDQSVDEEALGVGSNPSSTAETAAGALVITTGNDTVASLTVNGQNVTNGGTVTTALGVLTITGSPAAGYTYSYTLTAVTTDVAGVAETDTFAITVTDSDGDPASTSLVIDIVDDVPTARADSDAVTEGLGNSTSGNVISGAGGDGNPGGADTIGADTPGTIVGVRIGTEAAGGSITSVTGATTITGTYGNLVINPDGSYTYTLTTASIPASVTSETFTYEVRDADGDVDAAQIVITLNQNAGVPAIGNSAATVYEDGLADGVQHGSTSETTAGMFTVNPNGESYSLTLDGTLITGVGSSVNTGQGVLTITAVSAPVNGVITYSYSYTLSAALTHSGQGEVNPIADTIAISVTDATGDTGTGSITVSIVDDIVAAHDDSDAVTEGLGNSTGGNVISGAGGDGNPGGADVIGADTPGTIVGVRIGTEAAGGSMTGVTGATTITGTYGNLVINPNGSYTYTLTTASIPTNVGSETFTYQVRDADGDVDTAQLVVTLNQNVGVPAIGNSAATVYEDGLADGVQHGSASETTTGSFTVNPNGESYTLTLDGTPITGVSSSVNTGQGILTITAVSAPVNGVITYSYSYTLSAPLTHSGQGEVNPIADTIAISVTDATGDTGTGTVTVNIVDDIPVLGTIQNATANNVPASAVSTGTLNFEEGADGFASVTISPTLTGVTSGGFQLITSQTGNVLTAYRDSNGNGIFDSGTDTTAIFTITVDPNAGTSGQYTFDLLQPLDGATSSTLLGSGTSYGAGPSSSVIVSQGTTNLALVTGYQVTGSFSESNFLAGNTVPSSSLTNQTVNGSTSGWGVNNNNFTTGEFMRFDFGAIDDYDGPGGSPAPSAPAGYTAPNVTYANFDLVGYSASDRIVFVARDTNGGSLTYDVTGATASVTITALSGNIAWIDIYAPNAGSGKIDLTEIGTVSTTVNSTIPVSLTFTDGDGDTVTGSFNINVATTNSPSTAVSPVALDMDGGGVDFLGLAAGVTYDYDGDGLAEATAWVGPKDAILVRDADANGTVSGASEFVFGANGQTDLEALHAQYGEQLDASDADFVMFMVWIDANSDGVANANEVQSLTQAGIVSIDLVSNGVASSAAGGDVTIAGEGRYTYVNDNGVTSTGLLADAAFRTERTSDVTQRAALASSGSAVMTAAVAAMGLVASQAAATGHESALSGSGIAVPSGSATGQLASTDASAVIGVSQSALGNAPNDATVGQASKGFADGSAAPVQAALDTPANDGTASSSLLAPTETLAQDSIAASLVAPMIVMPSAESLVAIGQADAANGTQRGIAVEKVLAETLEGGAGGTDIDALLARLSSSGSDENPALGQLASQHGEGVPAWDMAAAGGLPDMHVAATAQDMAVFHHDAVQPAING
ncbi:MAG: Ig-like domain-containing protein, partial [Pseudomonadota bacterium]|nr:Ig-like domain-containing protein [Pseudomonadota bacterium]